MNVISFSLFGDAKRYLFGAIENIRLAELFYPDWKCRFYVEDVYTKARDKLCDAGAQLIEADPEVYGTFWRHTIALDETVDRYIVRDADSRLSRREAASVNEWIASGKPVHLMRDHPSHVYRLMCGLYGAVGGFLKEHFLSLPKFDVSGWCADTKFLNEHLLPKIEGQYIEHDDFHRDVWPDAKPHPEPRDGWRFLGESFDEENQPDNSWMMVRDACASKHSE